MSMSSLGKASGNYWEYFYHGSCRLIGTVVRIVAIEVLPSVFDHGCYLVREATFSCFFIRVRSVLAPEIP